jgi:hypothetical protein
MFRGVISKFIVGEDCPGNNVRSHIQPPFLLNSDFEEGKIHSPEILRAEISQITPIQ